jgi:calcineurin-like phosphoesterase family protein
MAQVSVRWSAWMTIGAMTVACDRAPVQEPQRAPAPQEGVASIRLSERLSRRAPSRLVAIGDLHGDLDHTRRALRLSGAIDAKDHWTGGSLVVVQTGDEIDRGDDDREILDSVERWEGQARATGGEFIALLGNHELMNAALDFRYVTPRGFASFGTVALADAAAVPLLDGEQAGRAAAFGPGGPYATLLGHRPIVMKVGDTVFVHGGILPKHVRYGLDRMNDEVDSWLLGNRTAPPEVLIAEDGPVWTRKYSAGGDPDECSSLAEVLSQLGAKRMVVGHTVQAGGITSDCNEHVWRIDVGLSRAFGGRIEALQIEGDSVVVLREP